MRLQSPKEDLRDGQFDHVEKLGESKNGDVSRCVSRCGVV